VVSSSKIAVLHSKVLNSETIGNLDYNTGIALGKDKIMELSKRKKLEFSPQQP